MPVLYYLAERMHASCTARGVQMLINIITNGLLLTREMVERLNPLGPERHQDHARRRPRGAQRVAPAARRPGDVRQDHRQHARGGRPDADRGRRQLRDGHGRLLSRAARLPRRAGLRAAADARSTSSRSSARRRQVAAKGHDSADGRRRRGQAAQRRVHDVGRHRRQPRLRLVQLRRRQDVVPARGDEEARLRHLRRRAQRARAKSTRGTPTRSGPTARSSPARASPARRCSRPATSTAGRRSTARRRCGTSRSSRRGRCATTARSSRSAPAAAPSPRTTSSATCTRPIATSRASRPA